MPTEASRQCRASRPALATWLDTILGAGWTAENRSRTFGRQSVLWYVTAGEQVLVLKCHEERGLFERASLAYREWLPGVTLPSEIHVPDLVAYDEEQGAFLMTRLPGCELGGLEQGIDHPEPLKLSGAADGEVFMRAGQFLRTLHDARAGSHLDPTGARAAWIASVERYMTWSETMLEPALLSWARAFLLERSGPEGFGIEGLPLVYTHADFTPRNWIWNAQGGGLGIIDWERARLAPWIEDVHALHARFLRDAPARSEAFWNGYGHSPTQDDLRLLAMFFARNTIGGVAWAHQHEDHAFEALCRRELERLREAWS